MKKLFCLLPLLAALSLSAQTTNAPGIKTPGSGSNTTNAPGTIGSTGSSSTNPPAVIPPNYLPPGNVTYLAVNASKQVVDQNFWRSNSAAMKAAGNFVAASEFATPRSNGVLRASDFSLINMRAYPVKPPRMFFEPWVLLHTDVGESNLLNECTNIVNRGYYSAGWNSVLIDEPWLGGHDANGVFYADTNRFPSGVDNLITNLHNLGFEVGFFFTLGDNGVEGPGSNGFIEQDATNAVLKGIDFVYLVVDDHGWGDTANYEKYRRFIATVRALGSDMDIMGTTHRFEPWLIDELGAGQVHVFDGYVDNFPRPTNFWLTIDAMAQQSKLIRPGHYQMHGWLGATLAADGVTFTLNGARSSYALMSMFHSPLSIINTYLDGNNPPWKTVQTNQNLVTILRDSAANPPTVAYSNNYVQVWSEKLVDRPETTVLAFVSRHETTTNAITVTFPQIGLPEGVYLLTDCWNGTKSVIATNGMAASVGPYDTLLYFVEPWRGKLAPITSPAYATTPVGVTVLSGQALYSLQITNGDAAFEGRYQLDSLFTGSGTSVIVNASLFLTNATPWKLQPKLVTYHADGTIAGAFINGISVSGTNPAGVLNLTSSFNIRSNTIGGYYSLLGYGTNTSSMFWYGTSALRR